MKLQLLWITGNHLRVRHSGFSPKKDDTMSAKRYASPNSIFPPGPKINEWQLTQAISIPGSPVYISVSDKSVHDAQCVVSSQLQQERSVIIWETCSAPSQKILLWGNVSFVAHETHVTAQPCKHTKSEGLPTPKSYAIYIYRMLNLEVWKCAKMR